MSIAACIGIPSDAGAGAGPRHLFDDDDNEETKVPDIVFPSVRPRGVRAMVTDVTVTGVNPTGIHALPQARQGAKDPDHFVIAADKRKNRKYLDRCTQNGYAFTPCAFSSGGRPSPGALYLFNTLAEAAGDSIEPWYFYNCLLPRLFLTLAIEQYKHDKVTHDAILRHIRLAAPEPLSELDEPLAPAECPPPHYSPSNPRTDDRWGPSSNGQYTYDPTRGPAFESLISSIVESLPRPSPTAHTAQLVSQSSPSP